MLEFTGERVVSGAADPNLFNEHKARYRFAARFARRFGAGAAILDAGCGTGYGTAEFAGASVTAFDIAAEAVLHARDAFPGPGVRYLQASCEAFPFQDNAFDLATAFEVIEHLEHWPALLREAKRVLKPNGVLLVSTPNKSYYAESRGDAGPNPFHVHEFGYEEFRSALGEVFPCVTLWTQNHSEVIAFLPRSPVPGTLDASEANHPETAHFYLAACSALPIADPEPFAYLPSSANILRDRERHVALLTDELAQKTTWLEKLESEHATLHTEHGRLLTELADHNAWAEKLDRQLAAKGDRILALQDELATAQKSSGETIASLEKEAAERLSWIGSLESEIAGSRGHIRRLEAELSEAQAHAARLAADHERALQERLNWVQSLENQLSTGNLEIERLNNENQELRVAFDERTRWGQSHISHLSNENAELRLALEERTQRAMAEISRLNEENTGLRVAFEERTQWAGFHIDRLSKEALELRLALEERTRWAGSEISRLESETSRLASEAGRLESQVVALSGKNSSLEEEIRRLNALLDLTEGSKWVRLGRAVNLGPDIRGSR